MCWPIVKSDEHKCYIWLKTETPNDLPTFVVGCYIPHQDSNFYACLDKDQPFANLEDDIAYLKSKGEVKIDMASLQREYWAGWDSMASVGLWLYLAYERRVLFKRLYLHNSRVCTREWQIRQCDHNMHSMVDCPGLREVVHWTAWWKLLWWGVKPRMAPPPHKGGVTCEGVSERERQKEKERQNKMRQCGGKIHCSLHTS